MSRGRGFADSRGSQHTSKAVVDNRPKQVLVAGYEEKDKDAVVAQFAVSVALSHSCNCICIVTVSRCG